MPEIVDPLEIGVKPHKSERHTLYRNGEVEVFTFENEDTHMCYGVDASGEVWDFCYIGDRIMHIEGKLSIEEIVVAKKIAKEFS